MLVIHVVIMQLQKHVEGFKNTSLVVHVISMKEGRKEGRILFNDTHNTFN